MAGINCEEVEVAKWKQNQLFATGNKPQTRRKRNGTSRLQDKNEFFRNVSSKTLTVGFFFSSSLGVETAEELVLVGNIGITMPRGWRMSRHSQ